MRWPIPLKGLWGGSAWQRTNGRRLTCLTKSTLRFRVVEKVQQPRHTSTWKDSRTCRILRVQAAIGSATSPSAGSATLLGYLVLLGSTFRSIPQIVRVVRKRSADGLTLLAVVAELLAYSITWAYNSVLGYPFSSYGEIVCCWLQDVVLIAVILNIRRQLMDLKVLGASISFFVLLWLLMTNQVGWQVLTALQASTIAIIALGGRVPQILMNVRRGNSGELSIITTGLNVIGCAIRIFTTLVLTQDPLILWGSVTQGVLNTILFIQTLQTALNSNIPAAANT